MWSLKQLVEMRALVLEVYLLQRSLFYRPVKQKQKNSSITWTYSIAYYILVIWFSCHYWHLLYIYLASPGSRKTVIKMVACVYAYVQVLYDICANLLISL